ncbi:IclR family transcriptional regulator [Paracoccus sp. (in: a-proteobacteria)]|uniref:IclR family transcriptional regulator n=1 Tax=Paracoccus sp. TaxID=267 RepID=UPI003A8497D9
MSTISNATQVLKLLARLQRDVSVSDVTNMLDWPKSSASRTLSKMASVGFLERNPDTRAYRPGKVVMEASYYMRASTSIQSLLETELDLLVAGTGYASYVNLLDGAETLVVQMRVGTAGALQVYSPVGTRGPAYASSMGRAMLSRLPDAQICALAGKDFSSDHGNAPRSAQDLMQRIDTARAQGWAMSRAEFIPGVTGISAAVVEADSQQVYGIGIALPGTGHSDDVIARFGIRVRNAAQTVGRRIGDNFWLDPRFEPEIT